MYTAGVPPPPPPPPADPLHPQNSKCTTALYISMCDGVEVEVKLWRERVEGKVGWREDIQQHVGHLASPCLYTPSLMVVDVYTCTCHSTHLLTVFLSIVTSLPPHLSVSLIC